MSPDGEWMWNGSEWIPAPPSHDVVPAQAIGRERIQQQAPEVKKRIVPWVGVGAIALSLLLPFISVAGIFELTGLEMITEISDLMSEFDTSGEGGDGGIDDGSSDGVELSIEEFALLIAITLFLFSPFFFILSAIVSTIALLFEKSPKLMGSLHLGYALLFVVSGLFSPSELGISIFDFIGVGFYIGAFASVLLVIDA
jgi:hypothetical protein